MSFGSTSPILRENLLVSPLVPENEDEPGLSANFLNSDLRILDAVGEWVFQERRVVTAKYLSRRCQIHFNSARIILNEFARRYFDGGQIDVIQCRIISGHGGLRKVCLVKQRNSMQGGRNNVYAVALSSVGAKRLSAALRVASKLKNPLGPPIEAAPIMSKKTKELPMDDIQRNTKRASTKSHHPKDGKRSKHHKGQEHHEDGTEIKTPPIKYIAEKVLSKACELESAVAESEVSVSVILAAMEKKQDDLKSEITRTRKDVEVICKKVEATAKEVAMLRRLTDDKENRRPNLF